MDEASDIAERCVAISRAAFGRGDLDAAVAALHRLPADLPVRGVLAADLLAALLRSSPALSRHRLRHVDGLMTIADRHPPGTPDWPAVRAAAQMLVLLQAGVEGRTSDPTATLAEVESLVTELADQNRTAASLHSGLTSMLGFLRAMEEGDEGTLHRFPAEIRRLRQDFAGSPEVAPLLDVFVGLVDVVAANRRGDDVQPALDQLRRTVEALPPDAPLREQLAEMDLMLTSVGRFGREDGTAPGGTLTDAQLTAMADLARRPDLSPAERAHHHAMSGGAALGSGWENDPARIDEGIEHLRSAVALAEPADPRLASHLLGLAIGLFHRGELTNSMADVAEADALLERARQLAGSPGHPMWATINEVLSHTRRRGGAPAPYLVAVEGLRDYVWKALLQTDVRATGFAVRRAARDAVDIARQCLTYSDPVNAIRALDAGRGLALGAAIENRRLPERLDSAGHPELARRWRQAAVAGTVPTDLRREALTALTGTGGGASLLDAPTLAEIRAALVSLDADALVYLMPGDIPMPGFAVIAPARGQPSFITLPNLHLRGELDVERYLTALDRRDAAVGDSARDLTALDDVAGFADSLDSLCDWAWRAAIGPLIEKFLPTVVRPGSDRPPRLVLVPMGELARIPWQAARRRDGTYAVELAAFSQAASARLLCRSASLAPVPLAPVGLVVGDPDTRGEAPDLVAARAEAYAVHRSFYPGARYVGRRMDGSTSRSGPGRAEEVRDWLTSDSPAAGGMLHLACHGVISTDPASATSYLLLADGGRLSADELVALTERSTERAIRLVVLAACRTGQAINGYDEAYSLGTAFLAGGARSVLSAQWAIPDRATSVLMYMFHHHLATRRLSVWEALRQAQIWMLDPHRSIPVSMPEPLRRQLAPDELAHVSAWAGFVHFGQ
ncbi:CHAT domain-containing protein [Micromonospora globbae]|uniref:CHAT domain-containing protein n=1 Tax=Micromonospora globbae TaxID=1894969 RepID=A0ABZ1S8I0_9ACTN|nr:CHAT domain-containing protein [Micromonospora globbae]